MPAAREPAPTAWISLVALAGTAGRAALGSRLPAYTRHLPDGLPHQRERLEANAALVEVWSAAAGVPAAGDGWSRHAGGAPRPPRPDPRVSLSHARGVGAIAVCAGAAVGVDVERRRRRGLAHIARGAFAAAELRRWERLDPDARADALLHAWTRKEAVLKALGTGLAGGLRRVELDAAGALIGLPAAAGAPADWTLAGMLLGADIQVAVAVRHPGARVVVRRLEAPADRVRAGAS